MCKIRSVMVSCHFAYHAYAIKCTTLYRYFTWSSCCCHVHGEVTIADVAFEVCRRRVGLQVLSVTKGVDHRVNCRLSFNEGAAVTTARSQDEHIVVDPSSWEDSQGDRGVEGWF